MGKMRIAMFSPFLGNSVLVSDGAFWSHSRALFRPHFNKDNVNNLDHTEEAIQGVIDAIGPSNSSGWTKDTELLPLTLDFTLETGTGFLFGEPVKSGSTLSGKERDVLKQFKEDFETAENYMNYRVRLQSLYWLADGPRFRNAIKRIRGFTERFVDKAIAHTKQAGSVIESEEKKSYNLLSALATQTQNRSELRDQTLGTFLPSFHQKNFV